MIVPVGEAIMAVSVVLSVGPAVIGIELQSRDDFEPLLAKLEEHSMPYVYLNDKPDLFRFLV